MPLCNGGLWCDDIVVVLGIYNVCVNVLSMLLGISCGEL